jgi:hypothetical protein
MPKIPIKIKNNISQRRISDDLQVNLRNDSNNRKQKQPLNKRLFLVVFLILILIIIGLLISGRFLRSRKPPFWDLALKKATVFSLIEQNTLYEQLSPVVIYLRKKALFNQELVDRLENCFNQANLNFKNDIETIFKDRVIFMVMPSDSETILPALLVFEKKDSSDNLKSALNKAESVFKENCNLSFENYRQIEIASLKPFNPLSNNLRYQYFYAQVENYFIIANSKNALEQVIDFVLE